MGGGGRFSPADKSVYVIKVFLIEVLAPLSPEIIHENEPSMRRSTTGPQVHRVTESEPNPVLKLASALDRSCSVHQMEI